MAAILCTVAPYNSQPSEEAGPHFTADGKYFFCTITVNGTYDQADRPKIIHDSPNDLFKVAGIRFVKAIEWLSMAASGVTGNNTNTGRYVPQYDFVNQRLKIFRCGVTDVAPTDQSEIGTNAAISGAALLLFSALVLGD